jgi:profilin
MSWQQYVDDHLMCGLKSGGQLTSGAIVGLDGGIWAQSARFPAATVEQLKYLVAGFNGDAGLAQLQGTSPVLGDDKYFVIQSEAGVVIRGKCGKTGMCAKRTNQALVIGIWEDPVPAAESDSVIEALADYLIEQGF